MKVIRKKLTADEITPANVRYNTTTHAVQTTTDGGTTWVDNPGSDPRTSDAYRLPPRAPSGTRNCDAAANMTNFLKAHMDTVIAGLGLTAILSFLSVLLYLTFFPLGLVLDIVFTAIISLQAIGSSTLNTAMTTTVYNQLTCIFFCNLQSDGTVSAAGFANIQSQVTAQIGGTAATAINLVLSAWGPVQLSNAGATGTVTGSCGGCTGCEYCFRMDFAGDFGGPSWRAGTLLGRGRYVAGVGFLSNDSGSESSIFIQLILDGLGTEALVDRIDIEYDGTFAPGGDISRLWTFDHTGTAVLRASRITVSGHNIWSFTTPEVIHGINTDANANSNGQAIIIRAVTIYWHVAGVTFVPNCV